MFEVVYIRKDGTMKNGHPCLLKTRAIAEEVMRRKEKDNKPRGWVWDVIERK